MAFNQNKSESKNQFSARIISNKTGNMICWAHITDDMARRVFGVNNVAEVTYAAAVKALPVILDNANTSVVITDLTSERELIPIESY